MVTNFVQSTFYFFLSDCIWIWNMISLCSTASHLHELTRSDLLLVSNHFTALSNASSNEFAFANNASSQWFAPQLSVIATFNAFVIFPEIYPKLLLCARVMLTFTVNAGHQCRWEKSDFLFKQKTCAHSTFLLHSCCSVASLNSQQKIGHCTQFFKISQKKKFKLQNGIKAVLFWEFCKKFD